MFVRSLLVPCRTLIIVNYYYCMVPCRRYWFYSRRGHHTPNASDAVNFTGWLHSYHGMVNPSIQLNKVSGRRIATAPH